MPEKMRALWRGKIRERKTDILDAEGKVVETISEFEPEEFLQGVPARSLTDEEYEALPEEQQIAVRENPLYDLRTKAEMSTAGERGSAPAPTPVEEKKES